MHVDTLLFHSFCPITYRSVPSVTAAVASAGGGGSGMGGCASTGNGTNADREPYTSRTSLNHEIAMAGNSSNSRPQSRSHSHHCHAQQGCDYPSGWPQCSKNKHCLKPPINNNCAIHPPLGFKTCKKMCGADVVTLSYHDVDSSFDWNSESDDSYIWKLNQNRIFQKKILDLCCIGSLLKMHYDLQFSFINHWKVNHLLKSEFQSCLDKAYLTLFQLGRNTFYLISRDKAKWE